MRRSLLHSALFLAGFVGTTLALQRADRVPFWSDARAKFEWVAQEPDGYDTIFVGSSRVECGVIPAEFDARMAELGRPTRSFNLALSGARPNDFDTVVDWLLEHRSPRLRRLVIELHSRDLPVREYDWWTDRTIELRGPRWFPERVVSILAGGYGLGDMVAQFRFELAHTLANALHIGQGPRILDDLLQGWRGGRKAAPVADRGFWSPETTNETRVQQARREFVQNPGDSMEVLRGKREFALLVGDDDSPLLRQQRAQVARLREAGLEVVYVVMPTLQIDFVGRAEVQALAAENPVLELDVVAALEPRAAPSWWFDRSHLSREGAAWASRRMADELVAAASRPLPNKRLRTPPPVLVRPPLLTAARDTAAPGRLSFAASELPAEGDVLVVVAAEHTDVELLGGVHLEVALPGLAMVTLARTGPGTAAGSCDLPAGLDGPLWAQLCVQCRGVFVAVSRGAAIPPR